MIFFEKTWSSEWRGAQSGCFGKGSGRYDASQEPLGACARFGPLASFTYRYFMSSMRLLQMRASYLLLGGAVVHPQISAYVANEIGHTPSTGSDAFTLLCSTTLKMRGGGSVKNFERWLFQRDAPAAGVVTYADAKITQTPALPTTRRTWMTRDKYDWIARYAPNGVIGFSVDRAWAAGGARSSLGASVAVLKVTAFDYEAAGTLKVTQAHTASWASPTEVSSSLSLAGDNTLKTFTFRLHNLTLAPEGSAEGHGFDFEVRGFDSAGAPQPIIVSMVRLIKE